MAPCDAQAKIRELEAQVRQLREAYRKLRNIASLILEADDAALIELKEMGIDEPEPKLTKALRAALTQPQREQKQDVTSCEAKYQCSYCGLKFSTIAVWSFHEEQCDEVREEQESGNG
jgi:hypothetical protein